jgi:hypothetical protein
VSRIYRVAFTTIVALVAASLLAYAQLSPQDQDLLKKGRVLGKFGNWLVSDGETTDGSKYWKYCEATSLTASQGGRVSLRVLLESPLSVEWQVLPSDTAFGQGLSEIEAKRLLLATLLAPSAVASRGTSMIQTMVRIAAQGPFPVTFTLIRIGTSEELRKRYWWLTELETLDEFGRVTNWAMDASEMQIAFPNTGIPDLIVSMTGFPSALAALKRCAG